MIDSHPDFQRKCVATSKKATFSQCICFAVSLLHTGSASLVQFVPVQFCFSCFNHLCQSLCLWLTLKPEKDKAVKFQRNLSKLQVTQGGLTQETSDRMWVSTAVPSELLTVGWCLVYCETPDCSPPTPNFREAVTKMSLCAFLFCCCCGILQTMNSLSSVWPENMPFMLRSHFQHEDCAQISEFKAFEIKLQNARLDIL